MIGRRPFVLWLGGGMLALCIASAADRLAHGSELLFNHPGGFCDSAFSLALTTAADKATIYYTTNGDEPLPGKAKRYVGPIIIGTTTIVRAAVFDSATNLGDSMARTFLFVPDVINQTGSAFPQTWGSSAGKPVPAYYHLTTAMETNATTRPSVATALRSLPTFSIIGTPADFFSPETGIYSHPMERGRDWERGVSLEMFDADGKLTFQCACGLRIHGGTSRQPDVSPKHSFRILFKKRYGTARLDYPLFGPEGVQRFNTLILRAGNNDSWLARPGEGGRRADYLRDEWMRRSMQAMGHPSARGYFVHLYLNGLYWGIYDLCETPGSDLLPADNEDAAAGYDVRKGDKIEAGDAVAWNQIITLANAGLNDDRRYQEISRFLDLPELVDYLILNFYAGNSDWDRSANWVAIRPHTPGGRFQFLVWDGECTLGNVAADTLGFDDDDSPPHLFHKLSENPAFRKLFARRAQQLLFRNGLLSPEAAADRYRALANSLAPSIAAEAARWGAYGKYLNGYRNTVSAYTIEKDWKPEVERIQIRYFLRRGDVVAAQFRENGLLHDSMNH